MLFITRFHLDHHLRRLALWKQVRRSLCNRGCQAAGRRAGPPGEAAGREGSSGFLGGLQPSDVRACGRQRLGASGGALEAAEKGGLLRNSGVGMELGGERQK